jgi:hypothetical protein
VANLELLMGQLPQQARKGNIPGAEKPAKTAVRRPAKKAICCKTCGGRGCNGHCRF